MIASLFGKVHKHALDIVVLGGVDIFRLGIMVYEIGCLWPPTASITLHGPGHGVTSGCLVGFGYLASADLRLIVAVLVHFLYVDTVFVNFYLLHEDV